jgi:hypothetical protein
LGQKPRKKEGQKIIGPSGGMNTKIWLSLSTKLLPTDTIVVQIVNDSNQNPGSTLLTSGSVAAAALTGDFKWIRIEIGKECFPIFNYHS